MPKVFTGLRIRKVADRSQGERHVRLIARDFKLLEDGSVMVDPAAAEKILWNPATDADEHEPWPFLGVRIEGDPPRHARIPTSYVAKARHEGWLTLENPQLVHRSAGPIENPWVKSHPFVHADTIVIHTLDGDVRYRVVEQPDKWPETKDDELGAGFGGEVRHHYDCELEA